MSDNEAQIEYWNEQAGSVWAEAQQQISELLRPYADLTINRAAPVAGERAIDVGCGCGDTSLALAERGVGVWGIDVSGPMLALAKSRAKTLNLSNVAFAQTDAATQSYTPDHDIILSRFGVMFFNDPTSAFANLRSGLNANGRLVFACWQAPKHNAWITVVGQAIQPLLPPPESPPDPRAPGPFAFADRDYLAKILTDAGYRDLDIQPVAPTLNLGPDVETAMRFQSQIGPLTRALAELEGDVREEALNRAREALQPHLSSGGVALESAGWLVHARR